MPSLGLLDIQVKESRALIHDYKSGTRTFESCHEEIIVRKDFRDACKNMVTMTLIAVKGGDKKTYERLAKRLVGSSGITNNELLLELPKNLYDRTADRGKD